MSYARTAFPLVGARVVQQINVGAPHRKICGERRSHKPHFPDQAGAVTFGVPDWLELSPVKLPHISDDANRFGPEPVELALFR